MFNKRLTRSTIACGFLDNSSLVTTMFDCVDGGWGSRLECGRFLFEVRCLLGSHVRNNFRNRLDRIIILVLHALEGRKWRRLCLTTTGSSSR